MSVVSRGGRGGERRAGEREQSSQSVLNDTTLTLRENSVPVVLVIDALYNARLPGRGGAGLCMRKEEGGEGGSGGEGEARGN